jgi:hypothetical protein
MGIARKKGSRPPHGRLAEKGLDRPTAPARVARTRPVPTRVPLAGWLSMTPNPVVFALPSSPALATFVASAAPPPLPPLGCAGTFLSFHSLSLLSVFPFQLPSLFLTVPRSDLQALCSSRFELVFCVCGLGFDVDGLRNP